MQIFWLWKIAENKCSFNCVKTCSNCKREYVGYTAASSETQEDPQCKNITNATNPTVPVWWLTNYQCNTTSSRILCPDSQKRRSYQYVCVEACWKLVPTSNSSSQTTTPPTNPYYKQVWFNGNEWGQWYEYQCKERFQITFDANGWTVDIPSKIYNTWATYGSLPTPTKSWYFFAWWYTKSNWWTKINTTDYVTDSISIYAHWTYNSSSSYRDGECNYTNYTNKRCSYWTYQNDAHTFTRNGKTTLETWHCKGDTVQQTCCHIGQKVWMESTSWPYGTPECNTDVWIWKPCDNANAYCRRNNPNRAEYYICTDC